MRPRRPWGLDGPGRPWEPWIGLWSAGRAGRERSREGSREGESLRGSPRESPRGRQGVARSPRRPAQPPPPVSHVPCSSRRHHNPHQPRLQGACTFNDPGRSRRAPSANGRAALLSVSRMPEDPKGCGTPPAGGVTFVALTWRGATPAAARSRSPQRAKMKYTSVAFVLAALAISADAFAPTFSTLHLKAAARTVAAAPAARCALADAQLRDPRR